MYRTVCGLLFAGLSVAASGQGSFHYVSHHRGGLFSHEPQNFDLNEDGVNDFQFQFRASISGPGTGGVSVELHPLDETRVLADSFYFGVVSMLIEGRSVIDGSIPVRTDGEPPASLGHPFKWVENSLLPAYSLGGESSGGVSGIFANPASVVGFKILESDGYHNGWMRFEKVEAENSHEIRVADWAYNLTPGESILAGMLQVPEPGSGLLLIVGGGFLLWRLLRSGA